VPGLESRDLGLAGLCAVAVAVGLVLAPVSGRAGDPNARLEGGYLASAQLAQTPEPAEGTQQPGAPAAEPVYRIGPSDSLRIEVRREPELSGTFIVRPDGRLALPLVGEVAVVGKTPAELADALEARLADYITDPLVTVYVEQAAGTFDQRIRVIGEAVPPTTLPYREGMTALDVVLALGGLPPHASGSDAYLLRRRDDGRRRIDLDLRRLSRTGRVGENPRLQPGDIVVIPEGFFTGDWRFRQFVTARQTFTDNVDLEPDDEKEAALISEIGPGISLNADLARVQGALNASVLAERQSLNDTETSVDADVAGAGTFEWFENLFLTDVAASVSRQVLDSGRGTSASAANDANRETVQTYRVSPYVVRRLARWAQFQARYAGTLTLISDDEDDAEDDDFRFDRDDSASDSIQHEVSLTASSGPKFGRYSWTLTGRASELEFDDGDDPDDDDFFASDQNSDLSRREAILRNQYLLFRDFAVIGDFGYQELEDEDGEDSFESPLWRLGFRWTPSEDTSLFALAGRQDDDETITVEARHAIGARTTLAVTFDEQVATAQERLAAALPQNPEDIDDFDPRRDRFSIRDEVTRTQTLTGRVDTAFGRNSLGFEASYQTEQEDAVDGDDTEESILFGVDYGRPLSRDLGLSFSATYENVTFSELNQAVGDDEVEDDEIDVSVGLDYTGFQNLSLSIQYLFARRDSTQARDDFTENAVTISGRFTF